MVITKAEAIALNLWIDIKDIRNIKEGNREDMQDTLKRLYPHSSFMEDVKLWTEFPPNSEFTLSPGEVLILSKKVQERDNLPE